MPTDITDASIAAACVYCMMLARSKTLDAADGLTPSARATALGCANVIFILFACSLTFIAGSKLVWLSAAIKPFAAATLAVVMVHLAITLSRRLHPPLHGLLQTLAPMLIPSCLLTSTTTLLVSPAQNLLHAALAAIVGGFAFSLLLQLCVNISAVLQALPRINGLRANSLQFHALTLGFAALLAVAGSIAAGRW